MFRSRGQNLETTNVLANIKKVLTILLQNRGRAGFHGHAQSSLSSRLNELASSLPSRIVTVRERGKFQALRVGLAEAVGNLLVCMDADY